MKMQGFCPFFGPTIVTIKMDGGRDFFFLKNDVLYLKAKSKPVNGMLLLLIMQMCCRKAS